MTPRETDIGGRNPVFRTTIWSDVLAAGDPANPESRMHMDRLLRRYWKPAYAYIRHAWRVSAEDAKDLVQAFFARLLEKDFWSTLRPELGSFRAYIRRALRNFVINTRQSEAIRQKHAPTFSLDAAPGELERLGPAAPGEPPEQVYDREWFRCVMSQALDALRERLEAAGKSLYYQIFQAYCLDPVGDDEAQRRSTILGDRPAEGPTYEEVANRFGVRESDVRNHLSYCRTLLREAVRQQVRDYVATDDDVDRELKEAAR